MNFELLKDYDNLKIFRTSCDCMDPNCNLTCDLEFDKTLNMLVLTYYTELKLSEQFNLNFFRRCILKIKTCLKIIFDMPVEYQTEFIFKGEKHIQDYANLLNSLSEEIKQNKKGNI